MNREQFLLILLVAVISAFLGGALGVWFRMPPSVLAQDEPQKVIRAEQFQVVDQKGTIRAILGTGPDDRAHLLLYDAMGTSWATLSEGKDGPALRLIFKKAQTSLSPNALIVEGAKGASLLLGASEGLMLSDTKGNLRGAISVPKESTPAFLVLFDEEGKVVWVAP